MRCNPLEDIHIHKVTMQSALSELLVRKTEAIIRKVPLVRSQKQVIGLIFIFL